MFGQQWTGAPNWGEGNSTLTTNYEQLKMKGKW